MNEYIENNGKRIKLPRKQLCDRWPREDNYSIKKGLLLDERLNLDSNESKAKMKRVAQALKSNVSVEEFKRIMEG